jgi:hypothetical protein
MNFLVKWSGGGISKFIMLSLFFVIRIFPSLLMDHKPVLLKQASSKQELIHWENILIIKNKDRIINPVEGSRSVPTRRSNQNQSVMGWQWGNIPWKRSPYIQVSDVLCYKSILIIYRPKPIPIMRTCIVWNSNRIFIPFLPIQWERPQDWHVVNNTIILTERLYKVEFQTHPSKRVKVRHPLHPHCFLVKARSSF